MIAGQRNSIYAVSTFAKLLRHGPSALVAPALGPSPAAPSPGVQLHSLDEALQVVAHAFAAAPAPPTPAAPPAAAPLPALGVPPVAGGALASTAPPPLPPPPPAAAPVAPPPVPVKVGSNNCDLCWMQTEHTPHNVLLHPVHHTWKNWHCAVQQCISDWLGADQCEVVAAAQGQKNGGAGGRQSGTISSSPAHYHPGGSSTADTAVVSSTATGRRHLFGAEGSAVQNSSRQRETALNELPSIYFTGSCD